MILGNKFSYLLIVYFFMTSLSISQDKITSTPLINVDEIKPSFEELIEENEDISNKNNLKKKNERSIKSSQAVLIGLDKITAKSAELTVNLNESTQFGPLEIRVLECGKVMVNNMIDSVAYIQVKDLSKNDNEKVFIFNGWTFASDPSLTPFDHAIYDLKLINCNKA